MKKASIFLFVLILGSCTTFNARKATKYVLLGGGVVFMGASFAVNDQGVTKVGSTDPSKSLLGLGATMLVFGAIAACMDFTFTFD